MIVEHLINLYWLNYFEIYIKKLVETYIITDLIIIQKIGLKIYQYAIFNLNLDFKNC